MADVPYQPPSFVINAATSAFRHGMTLVAGFLAANGVIAKNQDQQFIEIGISIGLWGLTYAWSLIEKKVHQADAANQIAAAQMPGISVIQAKAPT